MLRTSCTDNDHLVCPSSAEQKIKCQDWTLKWVTQSMLTPGFVEVGVNTIQDLPQVNLS